MISRLNILSLAFCFLALLITSQAWAFCNPNPSSGVKCLGATDSTCSTLGSTTMDGDRENIIACMGTPAGSNCAAGQCNWKAMTTTSGSPTSPSGSFGGMYSTDVIASGVKNPYTNAYSCPAGYTSRQVFHGSNSCPASVCKLYFCFK